MQVSATCVGSWIKRRPIYNPIHHWCCCWCYGTMAYVMFDIAWENIPSVPSVQSAKCNAVLCKSSATVDAVVLHELCSAPCDKSVTNRHKSAGLSFLFIWKLLSCWNTSQLLMQMIIYEQFLHIMHLLFSYYLVDISMWFKWKSQYSSTCVLF